MNGLGGAYTLSLSGDAGFRVWTTTPAIGEPLLIGGQTVTNGVGVTFLSGDDTDLFVEAVSNGTATLTYAYAGTGDAVGVSCAASMKMTAWSISLVPDYDRDGEIGDSDKDRAAKNEVFLTGLGTYLDIETNEQ